MNKDIFKIKAVEYGITSFPEKTPVAMAYIPYQISENLETFSPEQGICVGTMFPDLNKPFKACRNVGDEK